MSILGIATPTLTSSTSTTASDTASLSSNYEMFMTLLVTQMQNQDPLNPTDTATFTSQLVQYSAVEQQIKSNAYLADLKALATTQNASNLVSYVGKTVEAEGKTVTFDGTEAAAWNFDSSAKSSAATITITNSDGKTVYTTTKALATGSNTFNWDGTTTAGGTAPAGDYTIKVAGTDASGNAVTITTALTGVVSAIDFSGTTPLLTIDGQTISAWKVTTVSGGS
ncbi:flagellar hook assembly protein FlgD [Pinisolibacter aquiterrae]|uniref:flagellar hook assembly protein FlgD n=1 Tax=Pinisolibacter aquiterrae TaxID=2815579 RepID=UPI001C3D68E4|nr:flagellar hook capping FlgD N-terminal domain-containing protein [Pinisolibacter aquiterrae]MBV5263429.1 flagellar hook assembly protein FlgD [Pinisolibacter aquiterrae]MCC8237494.1 flagellar hook assembly protein FlgD [Pinisolibacter aquiterrae]